MVPVVAGTKLLGRGCPRSPWPAGWQVTGLQTPEKRGGKAGRLLDGYHCTWMSSVSIRFFCKCLYFCQSSWVLVMSAWVHILLLQARSSCWWLCPFTPAFMSHPSFVLVAATGKKDSSSSCCQCFVAFPEPAPSALAIAGTTWETTKHV